MADVLYENPFASLGDLEGWVDEGPVRAEAWEDAVGGGAVVLSSTGDEAAVGDHAHFTLWCPERFPDRIRASWEFRPVSEPGLAMVFVAAEGAAGEDLFDPALAPRTGYYPQYHSGDIRALHVSYFRHKHASERAFRTCNLRKSPGFHLVAQGADPLPPAEDADRFYRAELVKVGRRLAFSIEGLPLLDWTDDGAAGPPLAGGRLGFRQMAPLVAAYRNLRVEALWPSEMPYDRLWKA
ncbi:DUF1961 family protein [Sinomonas sp. P47F7]|uniref:DUF1961 family protein n=1 Tax=Sinomonas sp. P47F7 TaxID=3410987 RepID=UPI003BF542F6